MEKIKEKSVIFKNKKGENLWGVLSLPKGKKRVPAVIIVHGFCGTKSERKLVKLGRSLAENDIAALRFDFSGCGDSEGDFKNLSIRRDVEDLKAAFKFLVSQAKINKKRIGFLGYSLGGLTVCLLEAEKSVARVLVLVAPGLDQKNLMKIWNTPQQMKKWRKQGYLDTPKCRIGIGYLNEAEDYTIVASEIKSPTLIIHGDKDKDVPLRYSRRLLKIFGEEKRLEIVEGADHKFESYQSSKKLINLSLKWFKKHF